MIKIRMHRGGLHESMETMMECDSIESVTHYLIMNKVDVNTVKVEIYCEEGDTRVGWKKVYLVQGRFKNDTTTKQSIYPLAFSDSFFELPKANVNSYKGL